MPTDVSSLLFWSMYFGWPFIVIGAVILTVAIRRRHANRHGLEAPVKHSALWRIEGLLWLWFALAALWGVITLGALIVPISFCIECTPSDRQDFIQDNSSLAFSAWAIPVATVYSIGIAVCWLLKRQERDA